MFAFGREISSQGYEMLSGQVVDYAAGLPLTIKVLGSFLCGKDELEWTCALKRLKTIPLKETLEILELSYNSLEEDYKEIFLDVACILKGWEKEQAIRVLECLGFHARSGLRVLAQKSLITLPNSGCLGMHDHIEEMGKNIVRRKHPNEPYKHSRLWIKEEVNDILVEDKGTEATTSLKTWWVDPVIAMKGLRKMKKLRFLDVECTPKTGCNLKFHDSDENNPFLPNSLQYLHWKWYPFTSFPKTFQANNLVCLKMSFSNMYQLWEGGERKDLKKLRFIDLEYCKLRTLDIEVIMNLERLHLSNCSKLELHMPVESFKLKFLSISHCKPGTLDLVWALNLVTLKLTGWDLLELRMPVECLNLKDIYVECYKLKILNLQRAMNLETLHLEDCHDLVELHMPIKSLKLKGINVKCFNLNTLNITGALNLEWLYLEDCQDLVELHMPVESLNLKDLCVDCSHLKTLNLRGARNLETLDLRDCESLAELHMPIELTKLKHLDVLCYSLKTLNLTGALNLETLDVIGGFEELYMPVESLQLKDVYVDCCKLKTLNLTGAPNLETLHLEECDDLAELHMSLEALSSF